MLNFVIYTKRMNSEPGKTLGLFCVRTGIDESQWEY